MPVEPGKIEEITTAQDANENMEFVRDQLNRTRKRLNAVQKFMLEKRLTGPERELVSAIDSILFAERRLNDAIVRES